MSLRTLYQTLLDSDLARLRAIAHQWEIELTAERRVDVAAELADAMARAERVERALAVLPTSTRAALDDLLRHEGALPWAIFARRWGELRAAGPGRVEREALWRDPASSLEDLWYRGFVQRAFEERAVGHVEMAFVPEELRLYMPAPPPLVIPPPEPVVQPAYECMGTDALADDLVTLWAGLQAASVDASAAPWRESVLRWLDAPAEVKLGLLETLAQEQGWVRQEEGPALRLAPDSVLAWLQADLWEQWSRLARAWMESRRWNDLAFVPTLRPDPVKGWPDNPFSARNAVFDMVRHCVPGTWYDVEQFVAYVREHATDFLRPDGDYDTWALRDTLTDIPLRGFDAWDGVEGALIAFMLTGPMAWLGMVDVGGSALLPRSVFRLNEAGAALLGLGEPPHLPEPPLARWRADGIIAAPARRRYERFQLSRIALEGRRGEDGAYVYYLTPASLARARQQRISVARILGFLEQATGRAVPPHLVTAIEQAYQGPPPARLERVWLLRVDEAALLDSPDVRPLIRELLGPGMALIHEDDRERALAMLSKRGILLEFVDVC